MRHEVHAELRGLPRVVREGAELPGSRDMREVQRALKPGPGLAPAIVAENQRRRLIDAFVHVAAADGYGQTTIVRVAAVAGVSKKTFYVHFESLEECFLSAYEHGSSVLLARMRLAYEGGAQWREGMREALRVLLETLAAEPAYARFSVVESAAAGPRVARVRLQVMADFRGLFGGPGAPRAPLLVCDAVLGGIHSMISTYIETGRTTDLPELLPALTYFALLPFVGKDEAATELPDRIRPLPDPAP